MGTSPLYARAKAKQRSARIIAVMPEDELAAIDEWGAPAGMPSRTAAIRHLLKKGLEAVTSRPEGGAPAAGHASQA